MKKFFIYSYIFFILGASIFFHYYLPKTIKVYVVGTEIKREIRSSGSEDDLVKDMRYVIARSLEDGKTLMFRNEDILWPPYFKFNSGDLAGKVMNYQKFENEKVFLATFYGWRIPILSMYPNLTKLIDVDEEFESIPWLNIIVLSVFYVAVVTIFILLFKSPLKKNS